MPRLLPAELAGAIVAWNELARMPSAPMSADAWHGDRPEMLAVHEIGVHLMGNSWAQMFFKAIAAGFLIATMVWLLPNAEAAEFWVIVLMPSLIAAGGFAHIVAGSVEAFLLVLEEI